MFLIIFFSSTSLANEKSFETRPESIIKIIVHEDNLSDEATILFQTLNLKFAKKGLLVQLLTRDEHFFQREKILDHKKLWILHLHSISDNNSILISLDHMDNNSNDLVREVKKNEDKKETAWTIALLIEEVIAPYLEGYKTVSPIGAGLALIEPPLVGGSEIPKVVKKKMYPKLELLGATIKGYYLQETSSLQIGPGLFLRGLLTPRFLFYLGVSLAMSQEVKKNEVDITVGHLPIEMLFGYAMRKSKTVEFAIYGGFSTGFTIYQTFGGQKTDVLFDPWVVVKGECIIKIIGPLAIYLGTGLSIVLKREVLQVTTSYSNKIITVYRQDVVLPLFDVGIQIWLE